jgi:hypothetical protein
MPNSNLNRPLSAEDASALATPPMDVSPPKRSEPHTDNFPGEEHTAGVAAGRLPEDVYTYYLSWWRAALRRKCVAVVERESEVIAKWQVRLFPPLFARPKDGEESEFNIVVFVFLQARIRSPWLDAYFLHTSMLGTHTFFLVFLPLFFFFGYFELGRG